MGHPEWETKIMVSNHLLFRKAGHNLYVLRTINSLELSSRARIDN